MYNHEEHEMDKMTILLVDDEEIVLRSLVRALRHDGYTIFRASNAFEALAILSKEQVQTIISDFKMPMESGCELLKKVKSMWPHITRIMLTANTNTNLLVDIINRGIVHKFISKPWNNTILRQIVKEGCAHAVHAKSTLEHHKALKEVDELWKNTQRLSDELL